MLTSKQIDEAAQILTSCRVNNSTLPSIPEHCRPSTIEDAYRVQDRFIDLLDAETYGWFGACTNEVIQKMLGLNEPYYAYLLRDHLYKSPANIDTSKYPPIVFECEFGFIVDREFTPDQHPYSREEIENAVVEICPVIEIVAGHLQDWPNQDVFSVIADNGTDGALVTGMGIKNWREIDLINTQVTLSINGKVERQGTGQNILGDPMTAFVWLVNAITRDGKTISPGHIHNTGTATDIYWAKSGDLAIADFETLGKVEVRLQ